MWWAHAYNPSTQEVEAGGSEVEGYPWLRIKFQDRLSYMRSHLKNE